MSSPLAPVAIVDHAHQALRSAVAALAPRDLVRLSACTDWTIGQVLEHAILDQHIWASGIDRAPLPPGDAFAPTGDLLDQPSVQLEVALSRAHDAWAGVDPGASAVPTPLPQGAMDAATASGAAALDAAIHAWDITSRIGATSGLSDDLAIALLPTARAVVEPLRQWGAYAAPLPADPSDAPADTLLRYLGRDPGSARPHSSR